MSNVRDVCGFTFPGERHACELLLTVAGPGMLSDCE
jgi:hypothetical protein